ncbi:MAG: hypothetical protein L0271_03375 [Gemmatimonadetes bacterium]|nr:hypothetical protein [Gemmatimonadota bacterium]
MRLPTDRSFVASALAAAAAALLCVVALARALTFEPATPSVEDVTVVPPTTDAPETATVEPRVPSEAALPLDALALAVDQDPFQPDRQRPEPYRLPGEDVAMDVPVEREMPTPPFRIIGTAVTGDAGLAIVQGEDGTPRVVGVGETVSGFRLTRVDPEAATVMRGGEWVTLMVEQPSEASSSNSRRRSASPNQRDRERALSEVLVEQLRERGLAPEFIEQITRMREQAARARNSGRGEIVIRPNLQSEGLFFRVDSSAIVRGRGRGGQ